MGIYQKKHVGSCNFRHRHVHQMNEDSRGDLKDYTHQQVYEVHICHDYRFRLVNQIGRGGGFLENLGTKEDLKEDSRPISDVFI